MANQSISKPKRICQVAGCNRKHYGKGYCERHYKQIAKHGRISGNPGKLKQGESNRYIFKDNVCIIELYDKDGNVKNHTIIDVEDYDKIKNFKWSLNGMGYVTCDKKKKESFRLHRIILGLFVNDKSLDHIDGNPLNNRKSNLRICTQQQNMHNMKKPKTNTSGYKGVSWDKIQNKWIACIWLHKSIHLGRFKNKIDGAIAYNTAAIQYFGEFARLNHI